MSLTSSSCPASTLRSSSCSDTCWYTSDAHFLAKRKDLNVFSEKRECDWPLLVVVLPPSWRPDVHHGVRLNRVAVVLPVRTCPFYFVLCETLHNQPRWDSCVCRMLWMFQPVDGRLEAYNASLSNTNKDVNIRRDRDSHTVIDVLQHFAAFSLCRLERERWTDERHEKLVITILRWIDR